MNRQSGNRLFSLPILRSHLQVDRIIRNYQLSINSIAVLAGEGDISAADGIKMGRLSNSYLHTIFEW
jgi:hypothetical protein